MALILVVDDEPLLRRLLRLILGAEGHAACEAADGGEALRACRDEPFDLVFCDIFMPNKGGLEAIPELRREFPGLKIVAMTGAAMSRTGIDVLRAARLLGADAVLEKPFRHQDLARVVAGLLGANEGATVSLTPGRV